MIRINSFKINPKEINNIDEIFCKKYRLNNVALKDLTIIKKSIDARKKDSIKYIITADVSLEPDIEKKLLNKYDEFTVVPPKCVYSVDKLKADIADELRPVIIGFGPAGMFCAYVLSLAGLRPVVFERGENVDDRTETVKKLWETGIFDKESNVQFGEGGAGTFSDGKLNTGVSDKDGRKEFILSTFVKFGASKDILFDAKPHVGTDVLRNVVKNMRQEIISLGGEIHFNKRLDKLNIENGSIKGFSFTDTKTLEMKEYSCNILILAMGHSSRDTFKMLKDLSIPLEPKPFAVGFRVLHKADFINKSQYGDDYLDIYENSLPTAPYKLTGHADNGRNVYSFCMCPGGYVVNASGEENSLCVNGMSYSKRAGKYSNSAIIVSVNPADFKESEDPLCGMYFQQEVEKKAFELCEGQIPVEFYEDFKAEKTTEFNEDDEVSDGIKGQFCFTDLTKIYPEEINEAFIDGMEYFNSKIKDFASVNPLLAGIESRTSSPVKILRNEFCVSKILGLYPCGEGAGYAGGIVSAAIDGIKVAESIEKLYNK